MTENELLMELEQLLGVPNIESDEVTVAMLTEKLKISPKNVRERLKSMVESGQHRTMGTVYIQAAVFYNAALSDAQHVELAEKMNLI